jgi:predicted NUDIX family phosphoesterase
MVIPTEQALKWGLHHGVELDESKVSKFLERVVFGGFTLFGERKGVERNEDFKQIIPYVVFTCGHRVFTYKRGNHSTEARLRGHRAIGVGGHINLDDVSYISPNTPPDPRRLTRLLLDTYANGLAREIREEVELEAFPWEHQLVGLLYNDETEVGRVHIGFIHHVILDWQDRIKPRNHEITDVRWMSLDDIRNEPGAIDAWATLCVPFLEQVLK